MPGNGTFGGRIRCVKVGNVTAKTCFGYLSSIGYRRLVEKIVPVVICPSPPFPAVCRAPVRGEPRGDRLFATALRWQTLTKPSDLRMSIRPTIGFTH